MKKLGYVLVAVLCFGTVANVFALTFAEYKATLYHNATLNSARSKMQVPYRSESTKPVEAEMSETEKEAMAEKFFKEMDEENIAMTVRFWKASVDSMREGAEKVNFTSGQKAQLMAAMDAMQPILKQMEKAESPEQFQEQLMLLSEPAMIIKKQLDW